MSHLLPHKLTAEKRKELLCSVADLGGNLTKACEEVEIHRGTVYQYMAGKGKPAKRFKEQLERAVSQGVDGLIDEAKRRAFDGVEESVHYQGVKVDTVTRYSDSLLMFLIKGNRKQYVDKYEISGPDGGPMGMVQITATVDPAKAAEIYAQTIKQIDV